METPSYSITPNGSDDAASLPEDRNTSFHGLPHFIPSQNIDLNVVIHYVRTFIDPTALVQHGAYPSCDTIAGFWIASDNDIYLEDAKVMLSDSRAWSEESQEIDFDEDDPLRNPTSKTSDYLVSKTWQRRHALGRAKRSSNPWPFIMRPRPGFLRYFNSRILAKDLSLLDENDKDATGQASTSDSVSADHIDPPSSISTSSLPSAVSVNTVNDPAQTRKPAESTTSSLNDGLGVLTLDLNSPEPIPVQRPIQQDSLTVKNNSTAQANDDMDHQLAYGNTVVHGGSVQLGNTYHRADVKRDSRSAVVAQNLTSSVIGGGLVYLGFKMAGDTGHSAARVVDGVALATTITGPGPSKNVAVQFLSRLTQPRTGFRNGMNKMLQPSTSPGPSNSQGAVNDVVKSMVWVGPPTLPPSHSTETVTPSIYKILPDPAGSSLFDLDEPPPPYQGPSDDSKISENTKPSRVYAIKHPARAYIPRDSSARINEITAYVELHTDRCQWLRSNLQSDLDLPDQSLPNMSVNQHALMVHDAVTRGDLAAIIKLAEAGVDLNERDHEGMTPLMIASFTGQMQIASYLLDHDIDPVAGMKLPISDPDIYFSAPLKLAFAGKQPKIASLLIDKGAKLPQNAWMPDRFAISTTKSNFKQISRIPQKHPTHLQSWETPSLQRTSVLSVAIMCGDLNFLKVALDICGDFKDQVDCPLHTAIFWPNNEALDLLLSRTKPHIEPKHLAVSHSHEHFCEPVLAVSVKNKSKGLEYPVTTDGAAPEIHGLNCYYHNEKLVYIGTLLDVALNLAAADDTFQVVEKLLKAGYMFNSKKQDVLLGNGVLFSKEQMYETSPKEVESGERNVGSLSGLWNGFRSLTTG